ncbi:T9SS sorting signal type C domain-containing protein [Hanstruepera ponticola]|uniref:T9SS sorting signal type C domain-containing protein n=1 Tax=Hanstruepera ponticola TaxID=2042995 RepID=UPI00177EA12E|nr:T9SS sorting signal type C domain-containing protein [Hanstruepera ponticola]
MRHLYKLISFSKNNLLFNFTLASVFILLFSINGYGQGATCATAESLPIGSCDINTTISDATLEAGTPTTTCATNFNREGWYTFTVTGGPLDVTIEGIQNAASTRNLVLQVLSGTCGALSQVTGGCRNATGNGGAETLSLTNLANGTYFLRVVNSRNNAVMDMDSICITSPCNAPTVTAATAITNSTATINWTAASPAPSNGYQYVVSTSNTTPAGAGTPDAGSPANVTGLTAGTTYYVFVRSDCGSGFSSWSGPVSFTTTSGPANDEPCGATNLTGGATCTVTNDTTVGATYTTGIPNPGCGFYQSTEPDLWFTTTVSASGALQIDAFDIGVMDPVIAAYSATSCSGPFTLIDCDDDGGNLLDSQLVLTGRTPGEVIYIRVWEYQGNNNGPFDICVTNLVDPCSSITNIPACGSTTINATIASGNGLFNDSCFGTPGDEQIYSFTPSVTGNYNITQISSNVGHVNYGYNTTCGPSGWTCIDDMTTNGDTSFFNFTAGTTYYIMLDTEDSTGGTVSFTLNCPPPVPPNDVCTTSTTLNCGDADVPGTTNGSTNVAHGTGCGSISNYGVWYTFIGDGNQTTIFTDADPGFDHEMAIVSGNCGTLTNIACVNASGAGGTESYTFITTNSTRYFVYIADDVNGSTDTGNFTISRSCTPVTPPPNDDCPGAIDLTVNASCVPTSATNEFASNSTGVANPSCANYQGGDVWFTVTVPPSPGNSITIDTQAGGITDTGMAVYTGTCAGGLTEIACDDDSGSGAMSNITLNNANDGITTGQVLYIRVWEYGNNNFGSFGICVTAPTPFNFDVEICQGDPSQAMATDLFCFDGGTNPPSITGTIGSGSFQTFSQPWFTVSTDPCQFSTTLFRRYDVQTFTVSADATYVFSIVPSGTTIGDTMGYIYDTSGTTVPGTCGTGFIAGDDDSGPGLLSEITAFLQTGVTYALVTTNALGGSTDAGTYEWETGSVATSAEWFDVQTGGTAIGSGSYFDPVTSGYFADTETPGTYSFWVGCPNSTDPRIETFYTINPRPAGVISGTSTGACGSYEITITINDPSATQWDIEYSTDGGTTTTAVYGISSPYTFTATEPVGTTYTLESILNYSGFCYADPADMTGSATVTSAAKTWNGTVSTAWTNPNNWSPSGVPTLSDCVIIPNAGANFDPIIDGTNDNAQAGSLTVQNGGYLLVLAGGTITVQNEVTVVGGGTFELEGANGGAGGSSSSISANLIQISDSAVNSGVITQDRATYVRIQDYAYWSSPVENYNSSSISGTQYIYEWIPTIYVNASTQFGNWSSATNTIMEAGKGYIVRGPSGNGNTNDQAEWNMITFNGTPHNGVYQSTIERGDYTGGPNAGNGGPGGDQYTNQDDNWNLLGNPYPSNLDADAFLLENAVNNTRIDGVVYLWTHGTKIRRGNSPFFGDYTLSYDEADYLAYNYTGSTGGFNGIIGSGQGFFVFMEDSYGTANGNLFEGTATFNNSMRLGTDEQFFRESNSSRRPSELERHRIWLGLVQPSNNVSTILTGYIEGATMGKDRLFDAGLMSGSSRKLYTLIDNDDRKYVIQGRALPFDDSDIIPLGVIIDQEGEYAIYLEDVDGIFNMDATQDIFIEDVALGTIHNLKESPYFFTPTEMGEFNDRFRIRFTSNSLGVDEFSTDSNITIMAPNSEYVKINTTFDVIDSVVVYDILGRNLMSFDKVNEQELIIENTVLSDGVLMVKVTLANGAQKIQKVVLRD